MAVGFRIMPKACPIVFLMATVLFAKRMLAGSRNFMCDMASVYNRGKRLGRVVGDFLFTEGNPPYDERYARSGYPKIHFAHLAYVMEEIGPG